MDSFFSLYSHGFLRIGATPTRVSLADPEANAEQVVAALKKAKAAGVGLAIFPELCLTGYSIDDLFHQTVVLEGRFGRGGAGPRRQPGAGRAWRWSAPRWSGRSEPITAPW